MTPVDLTALFATWESVPDDTQHIYEAMARLDYDCEFAELNTCEMTIVLTLAKRLKALAKASATGLDAN